MRGSLVAAVLLAACGEPSASGTSPRVFNGTDAQTCQWPSTVAVMWPDTGCSGTLIHPQIVVSASHCGRTGLSTYVDPLAVRFGEVRDQPEREVAIDGCVYASEAFTPGSHNEQVNDLVVCTLADPVDDVPIVPLIDEPNWETELMGATITIAGFGAPTQSGGQGIGERRKRFGSMTVMGFDWWLNDFLLEELDGLTSSCAGDSGGSAFVQLGDGTWRTAGALSWHWPAPANPSNTCEFGRVGVQNLAARSQWLAEVTGFDLAAVPPATNPGQALGTWAQGCGE